MRAAPALPILEELRQRIQRLERGIARHRTVLPFGMNAIDQHLPERGLAFGALHEVAGGGNGAVDGAAAALFTAGIAGARAAKSRGVCRGRRRAILLTCFEEGLRHGALGAVVAEVARLPMTVSRRLQLAAEGSGVMASPYAAGADSWRPLTSGSRQQPSRAGA